MLLVCATYLNGHPFLRLSCRRAQVRRHNYVGVRDEHVAFELGRLLFKHIERRLSHLRTGQQGDEAGRTLGLVRDELVAFDPGRLLSNT